MKKLLISLLILIITNKVFAEDTNDVEYLYNLASNYYYSIHSQTSDMNKSKEVLQKIIKIDPNYTKAYSLLGTIYYAENNMKEAKKNWTKACDLKDEISCEKIGYLKFN